MFGDRLLTFDRRTATSLELLRFKPELGESEPFEAALRSRVAQTQIEDSSIAAPRSVERWDGTLVLVSRYASGRRLSELLAERRGPTLTLECVRRIAPLLATLADATGSYAHGALTLDRLILSRDNRLLIVEHPLGAAVEALRWPAARLRSGLGVVVPTTAGSAEFTSRIDPIQLGFLALSLLLGRRIDASEYPANMPRLLDESIDGKDDDTAAKLRSWIERALQIGPRPLESARDAVSALSEMTNDKGMSPKPAAPRVQPPTIMAPDSSAQTFSAPPTFGPAPVASTPTPAPAPVQVPAAPAHVAAAASAKPARLSQNVPPIVEDVPASAAIARKPGALSAKSLALAAVTALAMAEAVVIGAQWYFKPIAVVEAAKSVAEPPLSRPEPPLETPKAPSPGLNTAADASAIDVNGAHRRDAAAASAPPSSPAPAPADPVAATAPSATSLAAPAKAAAPAAGSGQRVGGMTFVSPLELQVFEGGKRIGVSGGPIAATEGTHTVDLVNDQLGFRVQQTITIKPGELTSRSIPVPNGRLSINAVPWAEVWIDGSAAGQTPLANLVIPIGEHQITFRHPQLGEQRQTAVVKSDGVTRLSARMQQ